MTTPIRSIAAMIAIALCAETTAQAMTLTEFRKFTTHDQGTYLGAAIGMLTFVYATTDQVEKARCIQNWFFGKPGTTAPGPKEIRLELAGAAGIDPDKYHVEGIILGVTDKACPASTPATKR